MSALVELSNVGRDFDGGRIVAVEDVSLAIGTNETVAIVGRSGSGKSTILNLICGLDRPTRGEVRFEGRAVNGRAAWAAVRASRIGIVFQNFSLLQSLSARENIEVALLGNLGGARQRSVRALELLAHFGLADRATLRPAELSGGERQRLAIARALGNRPKLLLADEPTGSLDVQTGQSVMGIIGDAHREFGTAVIVVTHDEDVAALCGRRVEISDGRIRSDSRMAAMSAPAPASRIR
ncbi:MULTISPECIES: ABC transporter ATP-binding protein [unclassified Mesorhizobium]|uniref:ABC transporter ATP-binding protein n=1 Tax=unclassified Mesorhizobium TaxID=325217 RepID=UPI0011267D02|nr:MULTISPECIES: ABC transporter ATP-binding protein [unclassified Mesorhizobium]TPI60468.1 ABC transporter ATP-binding protein [Mesorhizobium sp. B3-1-7]TPJ35770.1 ABC transporter ATP-binding protein [Mesorhizobium sp. B2-8-3]UCI25075.1 ABC transporter ATP-binding protein [Mesorhizobium sp. B2-8-5]